MPAHSRRATRHCSPAKASGEYRNKILRETMIPSFTDGRAQIRHDSTNPIATAYAGFEHIPHDAFVTQIGLSIGAESLQKCP